MPVNIIDTLKPKNNGSFPVAEAADIAVSAGKRLIEVLAEKADSSDVLAETAALQSQIDQIEISSAAESVVAPEVAAARVGSSGTSYATLKARLDGEEDERLASEEQIKNDLLGFTSYMKDYTPQWTSSKGWLVDGSHNDVSGYRTTEPIFLPSGYGVHVSTGGGKTSSSISTVDEDGEFIKSIVGGTVSSYLYVAEEDQYIAVCDSTTVSDVAERHIYLMSPLAVKTYESELKNNFTKNFLELPCVRGYVKNDGTITDDSTYKYCSVECGENEIYNASLKASPSTYAIYAVYDDGTYDGVVGITSNELKNYSFRTSRSGRVYFTSQYPHQSAYTATVSRIVDIYSKKEDLLDCTSYMKDYSAEWTERKGWLIDGGHNDVSGYRTTKPIYLPEGFGIHVSSSGGQTSSTISIVDSKGEFIESIVGATVNSYLYVADSDCYVSICDSTSNNDLTERHIYFMSPLAVQIYRSELNAQFSKDFLELPTVRGYIKNDGTKVYETTYKYCCIECGENDIYEAELRASPSVYAVYAEYDDGTTHGLAGITSTGMRSYTFRTSKKGKVYFTSQYPHQSASAATIKKSIGAATDSILSGKKIIGIGDSLMAGNSIGKSYTWLNLLGRYGAITYNYGINGNSVAVQTAETANNAMVERIDDIAEEVPETDYFVLIGGANDKRLPVPVGEDGSTDTSTFKGALNVLINKIREYYPRCHIIFMTNYDRYRTLNSLGKTDIDYVNAMKEVCDAKHIYCYDNYHDSGVDFFDSSFLAWADEGVSLGQSANHHLSREGYEWILPKYKTLLESN